MCAKTPQLGTRTIFRPRRRGGRRGGRGRRCGRGGRAHRRIRAAADRSGVHDAIVPIAAAALDDHRGQTMGARLSFGGSLARYAANGIHRARVVPFVVNNRFALNLQ